MADLVGRTIGKYKITEMLGRGGMAMVYKAYQISLDRYVAMKILPEFFAQDEVLYERFQQEAKATARLRHPNIAQVYDFGREEDTVYLVMEFVPGGTLQDRLKRPISMDEALRVTREIADALSYAHRHGVIHRDVKPSNILLTPEEQAVLTDFGIAKIAERAVASTKTGMGSERRSTWPPSKRRVCRWIGRTDIYALGVVLFEMATGRVPYESETPMGTVLKHLNDPLPLPQSINPNIPANVNEIIVTCLAKSPANRYATAADLLQALDAAIGAPHDATELPAVVFHPSPHRRPWLGQQPRPMAKQSRRRRRITP